MVATVSFLGDPDPGPIAAGYLGAFLLAGAYLAIGSFFSSLTRNQVIAFVLSVVVCGLLLLAGSPGALSYMAGLLPMTMVEMAEGLSFESRFESMQRGVANFDVNCYQYYTPWNWVWQEGVAGHVWFQSTPWRQSSARLYALAAEVANRIGDR